MAYAVLNKKIIGYIVSISIFVFINLVVGCTAKSLIKDEVRLKLVDSIHISIDNNTNFYSHCFQKFENHLVSESREKNSIQFYNFDTGILDFEIQMPLTGPRGIGAINGFKVISYDSIFVIVDFDKVVYLIDNQGEIQEKIELGSYSDIEFGEFYSSTLIPILYFDSLLILNTQPNYNVASV